MELDTVRLFTYGNHICVQSERELRLKIYLYVTGTCMVTQEKKVASVKIRETILLHKYIKYTYINMQIPYLISK